MHVIQTDLAPAAIGCYSQAIASPPWVFLSGQIPLNPVTQQLVTESMAAQIHQVFQNIAAVCQAAGGSLAQIVKLQVYLTDLTHFALVNDIMPHYFKAPYPARAVVGVAALPRGAAIEVDGILCL